VESQFFRAVFGAELVEELHSGRGRRDEEIGIRVHFGIEDVEAFDHASGRFAFGSSL
jgi:hypothetical protein